MHEEEVTSTTTEALTTVMDYVYDVVEATEGYLEVEQDVPKDCMAHAFLAFVGGVVIGVILVVCMIG